MKRHATPFWPSWRKSVSRCWTKAACRRGEITPEELESARRSLISAVRAGLDTPAALDDWYIGMSIEPCDDPEAMLQKLPALTVGDVVRAAQRITTDTIYFLKGDEA